MLEDVKLRVKSYNVGTKVPVIAIVEKVISSRVSYIHAETIKEAIEAWKNGDEFDYDYIDDERQLNSNVLVITGDGKVDNANHWCYDDEAPEDTHTSDDFDL